MAEELNKDIDTGSGSEESGQEEKGGKLFTQEDVNGIVAKATSKLEKKFNATLETKLTEARKFAEMTEEQKSKQLEQSLAERESAITKRELEAEAKESLSGMGLPTELSQILDYTDAGACNESLKTIEKAFRSAVSGEVDKRLKSSATSPKDGGSAEISGVEQAFYKLNPKLKK